MSSSVVGAMVKTVQPALRTVPTNSGELPRCPITRSGRLPTARSALGENQPPILARRFT